MRLKVMNEAQNFTDDQWKVLDSLYQELSIAVSSLNKLDRSVSSGRTYDFMSDKDSKKLYVDLGGEVVDASSNLKSIQTRIEKLYLDNDRKVPKAPTVKHAL